MQKVITRTEVVELEKPIVGNTHEMRVFLLEQMVRVANGELEPSQVSAVARIAQQVYNFAKLEVQAMRARSQHKSEEIKAIDF